MNIGIFGLGITGTAVYKAFSPMEDILCYDDNQTNRENFTAIFGDKNIVNINDIKWTKLDKIVISPGVDHSHDVFTLAQKHNIKITSDIELFIQENPDSEFVFVTGTNGKSTVTALIHHILTKNKLDYHMGGNIGIPVMSLPSKRKGYILELSSFQIELLSKINPKIAVITNITPDHLDRYKTFEEYKKIKERILSEDSIHIIGKEISASETQDLSSPYLYGRHNLQNIDIAYRVCRELGLDVDSINNTLSSFRGLEHRMEFIGQLGNIKFYNDSKATNVSSALASLSTFNDIIWFAGGKFKESGLEGLTPVLANIRKAYLFGESRDLFATFLKNKVKYEVFENLTQAFGSAFKEFCRLDTNQNDSQNFIFLLAPACASYDQFQNFKERGDLFKKLAQEVGAI